MPSFNLEARLDIRVWDMGGSGQDSVLRTEFRSFWPSFPNFILCHLAHPVGTPVRCLAPYTSKQLPVARRHAHETRRLLWKEHTSGLGHI